MDGKANNRNSRASTSAYGVHVWMNRVRRLSTRRSIRKVYVSIDNSRNVMLETVVRRWHTAQQTNLFFPIPIFIAAVLFFIRFVFFPSCVCRHLQLSIVMFEFAVPRKDINPYFIDHIDVTQLDWKMWTRVLWDLLLLAAHRGGLPVMWFLGEYDPPRELKFAMRMPKSTFRDFTCSKHRAKSNCSIFLLQHLYLAWHILMQSTTINQCTARFRFLLFGIDSRIHWFADILWTIWVNRSIQSSIQQRNNRKRFALRKTAVYFWIFLCAGSGRAGTREIFLWTHVSICTVLLWHACYHGS